MDEKEYGTVPAPGTLRLERLIAAPASKVWDYLTDSKKRATWLAAGEMDLKLGGKIQLIFNHADLSPTQETVPEKYAAHACETELTGTITAIEPGKLLAYTWEEKDSPDSEVTFELAPEGNQCRLTITHKRLGSKGFMIGVAAGWHVHVGIMMDVLAGETPPPFWQIYQPMEAAYTARLDAY